MVNPEMIATEVALQTSIQPRRAIWTWKPEASPLEAEAVVFFPANLPAGTRPSARIRVSGQAAWLRPMTTSFRPPAAECGRQAICRQTLLLTTGMAEGIIPQAEHLTLTFPHPRQPNINDRQAA